MKTREDSISIKHLFKNIYSNSNIQLLKTKFQQWLAVLTIIGKSHLLYNIPKRKLGALSVHISMCRDWLKTQPIFHQKDWNESLNDKLVNLYSQTKYLKQSKEIKQNWTETGKSDMKFCITFNHYYQSFISERVDQALDWLNHFQDFPTIS